MSRIFVNYDIDYKADARANNFTFNKCMYTKHKQIDLFHVIPSIDTKKTIGIYYFEQMEFFLEIFRSFIHLFIKISDSILLRI